MNTAHSALTTAIQHRALTVARQAEALIVEATRLQLLAGRIARGETAACPGSGSDLMTMAFSCAASVTRLDLLVMQEFDASDEGAGQVATWTARALASLQTVTSAGVGSEASDGMQE